MHLLYVHQHFSTPHGSTGTRSYEFARELVAKGHQVSMLCGSFAVADTGLAEIPFRHGYRQGIVDGIHVIEIDLAYSNRDNFLKRAWRFILFSIKVAKYALTQPYDVIFCTSTPLTAAIPGILAKKIRKKPFIFEVRDQWPKLPVDMGVITNPVLIKLMLLIEYFAYKTADFGIGLAPGICHGMKRFGSLDESSTALIPNGCDLDLFSHSTGLPIPEEIDALLSGNYFSAIFAGAHGIANGLDAVIDAAIELKKMNNQTVKILFIGDGMMKPHLINRVVEEGLSQICYFFSPVPKLVLKEIFAKASLGLMILKNVESFYYGTSPNKFFDYISAGLPILANYPGWVADLIAEFHCGYVVSPNDSKQFADTLVMLALLSDSELDRLKQHALDLARSQFDRKLLSQQFGEICERVYGDSR